MKIGIQIPHSDPARASVPDLIRRCQLAEKNGFDSLWLEDHVIGGDRSAVVWLECFALLTVMALNTKKTVLGPIVTDVLRRQPVTLAQTVASLDRISDGRFVLGLGAGEAMNLAPFGIEMEHLVSRLEEAIKAMKLLWGSSPSRRAEFRGEHYSLSEAYMQVRPVQEPHPPIYIGAFGSRMLELTGRLADGWVPTQHSPETYKATLKVVHGHATRAGRETSSVEPVLCLLGCVRKDGEEARRRMVDTAKLCVALFPEIMAALVPEAKSPGPEFTMVRLREGDWRALYESAKEIPANKALTTVIAGDVPEVIEQIEDFAEAGVKHLIISLRDSDDDQVVRDF
ncbi:MAG: LLM class flavin-dependent oxidoreductase, partial [Thaumarchaeota archaeon]|nr:LLM class flavin-dependent oxidoreductase [Nitrososphaerota archaeon]